MDTKAEMPSAVVQQLAWAHREEPEALSRMLTYTAVRRRVFERMVAGTLVHAGASAGNA